MIGAVLTAQQVFDHTLNHIRKQGVGAKNADSSCKYRGPAGTSCAVGCHLTDEEVGEGEDSLDYYPESTVTNIAKEGRLPARLMSYLSLLRELQLCHDMHAPWVDHPDPDLEDWERRMKDIAEQFRLVYAPPQTGVQND